MPRRTAKALASTAAAGTCRTRRWSMPPPHWGWQAPSDQEPLQRLGSEWVRAQTSVVLRVPSALIPVEFNYLLNPAHSDFRRIIWADPVPFSLDPRFLQ
ncbi:MAG: RES family NAD+ phosphorylase [Nitrospira sp.]|nr:RES family NAD+ phosphorylase [Nitrospira sp.]